MGSRRRRCCSLARGGGWWWFRPRPLPVERHALLIGSIANGTNDPDFDGTLRQALTVHLGQSPFLDIVSDERLRQTLQMMGRGRRRAADPRRGPGGMRAPPGRRDDRRQRVGGRTGDGRRAGRLRLRRPAPPLPAIRSRSSARKTSCSAVGRIASTMRRSLGESVGSLERHNVPIQEATTPSLEALKAFTAGFEKRAAGNEIESIPFFERAIALDPNFALAYTTLSSIYGGLGETGRAEEYARLAYEHSGSVSERERLFISSQYHDRVTGDQLKAREALEVWKQSLSAGLPPRNALAVLLNRLGEYDRAILEAQDAMRLNPAHAFPVLEPRLRVPRRRPVRGGQADGRKGGRARHRDRADAPPALSAGGSRRRRRRGAAAA